jgi:hypothetical protein
VCFHLRLPVVVGPKQRISVTRGRSPTMMKMPTDFRASQLGSCKLLVLRIPQPGGTPRGGSQPQPAADLLQWDVIAWLGAGQVELGCRFRVNDFLLSELGKKQNRRLHLIIRKGVDEFLKAIASRRHVRA